MKRRDGKGREQTARKEKVRGKRKENEAKEVEGVVGDETGNDVNGREGIKERKINFSLRSTGYGT